jgi:hypothetical protein
MHSCPHRRRSVAHSIVFILSLLAWLGPLAALQGCSKARTGDPEDQNDEDDDEGRTETREVDAGRTKPPPQGGCSDDNPFCDDDKSTPAAPTCGNEPIDLDPVGVNVMIAIDGSASMGTHWTRIQSALKGLREAHPESAFGLQLFWGELQQDIAAAQSKANWCGKTNNRVLEPGDNPASKLIEFLGTTPPGPRFLGGLYETSPVIEALNYYLKNPSKLADPKRTNYLLFVTDGNDNCFGAVFTNKEDKLIAYEKLAIELGKLNIRVIPVGFDSASAPDRGGVFGATPANTDLDVLSTLLEHGGSGLTEVPTVEDPTKLADVIAQVGQTVRNCRFEIPDALDPTVGLNPFELSFVINGMTVPRDRHRREGWNFVDGNTSQVELFGKACEAVRNKASIVAQKTCSEKVCGTASVKVETKPRVVQFLFDVSASRIECADGTLNCLMLPGSAGRTSLTYWETVEHALAESLVAPINDDVEFGLQFFPGKAADQFSCDVATEPEIPPAQGTEITILSQMLEKLPFGLSPVVQVLENVAAAPGRLADPDVQGAVVMLSDGGDNCSGAPQAQIVERLGAAAKKLHDEGVDTYVVRYGAPAGNTREQEAQLRAIVENGGTARTDPSDPTLKPYVDAADDAALTAALSEISNTLASCSFALDGLPRDADKSKVNLYLNGETIPFDMAGAKEQGWSYVDAARTTIELYGDSCTAFKTNRKTSVIVELGCAPVIVF